MNTFLWSVRREVWEHRAAWIMPLVVTGFVVVALLLSAGTLQARAGMLGRLGAEQQQMAATAPLAIAASAVIFISFLVAFFYSVEALGAERKDRSLLFWKSMPVSDATTVLSKAFMAMVVHPAFGLVVALVTQLVVLLLAGAIVASAGVEVGPLFARVPFVQMTLVMVYSVFVHILWYAPVYALAQMLSAWVQRPLLWIFVPAFAGQALEHFAFGTSYLGMFLRYRLSGAMTEAFAPRAADAHVVMLSQLDPGRFFGSVGLWTGLAFAAAFIYATIHLRRSREPN